MQQKPESVDPEEQEIQRLPEEQEFFNSQEYWDQAAVERKRRKEVTFTVNGRLAEFENLDIIRKSEATAFWSSPIPYGPMYFGRESSRDNPTVGKWAIGDKKCTAILQVRELPNGRISVSLANGGGMRSPTGEPLDRDCFDALVDQVRDHVGASFRLDE
jgi:hypothetical protein